MKFIKRPLDVRSCKLPNTLEIIGEDAFAGCENLKNIEIPISVKAIGNGAFTLCNSLTSITIPNSVISLGKAFEHCDRLETIKISNSVRLVSQEIFSFSWLPSLKYVTVPDKEPLYRNWNAQSYDENDYMFGSTIENISGNTSRCPRYIVSMIHRTTHSGVPSSPFAKNILPKIEKSFSYFASDEIYSKIEQWQKKKEYETTAQYRNRITEANRQRQLEQIVKDLKEQYIKKNVQENPYKFLGSYDADYGTYKLTIDGLNVYAKVPVSDAAEFKANFDQVAVLPTYGIVDDQLAILSCDFKLNGKTYHSAQTYTDDDASSLAVNLPVLDLGLEQNGQTVADNIQSGVTVPAVVDDLDTNIPAGSNVNTNTFVVIIGNENYQRVAHVQYAANDATVFGEYCQKTLCVPQKNIRSYKDATYATIMAALKDIEDISKAYKGNIDVIFYYAGHGVPSESDQSAYLLPVDADGSQMDFCLSTKHLYQSLNSLGARKVIVLMNACFSGAQRGDGMLTAARGVALKVKDDVPTGNMVVFTAANGQQTAYPYKEKGHGMFTYFLLKKLQDTKGNVSFGDLTDYVSEQVAQQSVVVNKRSQTPTVIPANSLSGSWRNLKLQ